MQRSSDRIGALAAALAKALAEVVWQGNAAVQWLASLAPVLVVLGFGVTLVTTLLAPTSEEK